VHAIYPALVRLRPSLFARYLFVRAEKRVHVPHVAAAPRRHLEQVAVA